MAGANRRIAALVGSLVLTASPALALAQPGASDSAVRVSATLVSCNPAPLQRDRSATFGAQMNALASSRTMQMRFELQQSVPAHRAFQDVSFPAGSSPSFGSWQSSQPNIAVLSNSQTVSGLTAPASYRVIVHYRWLDARRRVLRNAQRITPVCRMPDPRPNLSVKTLVPTADGTHYSVVVRNTGAGVAPSFQVTLGVDGAAQQAAQTVAGLAPGTSALLSFPAPACASGQSVTVVIDPLGTIDETTKADNRRSVSC